jgi:hypothetical protein
VQHAQEADIGAEMLWIGSDLQQRFRASAEQQVVQHLFVLQPQVGQLLWQREDHMEVRSREQFLGAFSEPLVPCIRLALWAVAIAA